MVEVSSKGVKSTVFEREILIMNKSHVQLRVSLPLRLLRQTGQALQLLRLVVTKYQKRVADPLLELIELHVEIP